MRTKRGWLWLTCAAAIGLAHAQAATEKVVYSFSIFPQGANPYGPLARDSAGNLYGTTNLGGANDMGTVFVINTAGKHRVVFSFKGGSDGANPYAGVTLDSSGNLYGTTVAGGPANAGTIYKITPAGQETLLYAFTGAADGSQPYAGLVFDSSGNLYGTTYAGGTADAGTVYKLSPTGQETVLYSFSGKADGANPYAGVIADSSGNFYGTTYYGGLSNCTFNPVQGCGVVYKLSPAGQETVLHTFTGSNDGAQPYAGVIADPAGNLYGATAGVAILYKLAASGTYTILHRFTYGPNNQFGMPEGGLARDAAGNLYGTTQRGGSAGVGVVYKFSAPRSFSVLYSFPGGCFYCPGGPTPGVIPDGSGNLYGATTYAGVGGMVFRLNASGQETTPYSFLGAASGTRPSGGVIRDSHGNLYGATLEGGAANAGVVYKVDPLGRETVLYTFTGGTDGAGPGGGVTRDPAGNLYGTAMNGGAGGFGVIYKINTSGQQSVLHAFTGGTDGGRPAGGLALDSSGNLYGTASSGGAGGGGVVYKVEPSGQETVLHGFTGGTDGGDPIAGVLLDSAGNLYGTTVYGGAAGFGVVFRLDPSGNETVVYSFPGGPSGALPESGVILDSAGNLYGTTGAGGGSAGESGAGVIYKLDASGNETVLYTFTGGSDGGSPMAAPIRDAAGNLYGTTTGGGAPGCTNGCGVVYKLDSSGRETVLYSFTGAADGGSSSAGLTPDAAGHLFGTTVWGGTGGTGAEFSGGGVVFEITQ